MHVSTKKTNGLKSKHELIKLLLMMIFYLGFNAMRLLSESQEEKYRTLNINPNMNDFFRAEQKSLLAQSNTLFQFIKFIQEDRDNSKSLANISPAIIELQKEY